MRAETLKGHLDGMLLAALEAGPRHGYAVMEALRAGSGGHFDLPTGTVYPALRRLERAGLILGTWDEASGRRRRVYELTPAGARMLAVERGQLAAVRCRRHRAARTRLRPGRAMTGGRRIDGYLSEVAAALPGPARARDDIIAELRSGLLDA